MPIVHGLPPEQEWARDKYTEQEILNLVSADLNADGLPDVLDVRILGWQPILPPEIEIKNDIGNPVPVVITSFAGGIVAWDVADAVPSLTPTSIVFYVVPAGKTFYLSRVEASGENKSVYWVVVDGVIKGRKRTYYTHYNVDFNFDSLVVGAGKRVEIFVEHSRPVVSDHDANIQGQLI